MSTKPTAPNDQRNALTEELRARVPDWMKTGVDSLAGNRVLDAADILREAVAEYLERRNITRPANPPPEAPKQEVAA